MSHLYLQMAEYSTFAPKRIHDRVESTSWHQIFMEEKCFLEVEKAPRRKPEPNSPKQEKTYKFTRQEKKHPVVSHNIILLNCSNFLIMYSNLGLYLPKQI